MLDAGADKDIFFFPSLQKVSFKLEGIQGAPRGAGMLSEGLQIFLGKQNRVWCKIKMSKP